MSFYLWWLIGYLVAGSIASVTIWAVCQVSGRIANVKTPKRIRPQRTHNGVIRPLPYTVQTALPGGGSLTSQHATPALAENEVNWQMRAYGRSAEIVTPEVHQPVAGERQEPLAQTPLGAGS